MHKETDRSGSFMEDIQSALNIDLQEHPLSCIDSIVDGLPERPVPITSSKYLFAFEKKSGRFSACKFCLRNEMIIYAVDFAGPGLTRCGGNTQYYWKRAGADKFAHYG